MKMPKFNKHRTCARTNPTKKGTDLIQGLADLVGTTCFDKNCIVGSTTEIALKAANWNYDLIVLVPS